MKRQIIKNAETNECLCMMFMDSDRTVVIGIAINEIKNKLEIPPQDCMPLSNS